MGIYLDYASATPVDPDVLKAMEPFFSDNFFNPSALYGPAVEASKALDKARIDIAGILGAKPSEIIFTAGGTEANNLAVHGVMQAFPKGHIVISAIEHDSVRGPAGRYNVSEIPVSEGGVVDFNEVSGAVTDDTVLVSVMYANNEVGTVQPIRKIAAEIEAIRKLRVTAGNKTPLYFHTDAAQAGNYLDMHVHRLGVDLMTINGGKLYGPKQTGALFVRSGVNLTPLIDGGGQERNLRSGTENVAGAVGLAAALVKSTALRHSESERLVELREFFESAVSKEFNEILINGRQTSKLPNFVHITFKGKDNERILMALDMENVYAAAGSACSASHDEPSHVLKAMGMSQEDIQSSVRFTMGRNTTKKDIENAIQALKRVLA